MTGRGARERAGGLNGPGARAMLEGSRGGSVSPQAKEAAVWIGGAAIVALAVAAWLFATAPPFDELATRYSIL